MNRIIQTTLIFFKIFLWLVYLKKEKNENGKIRHYSFKMTDNDLKIWHNNLLPNPFHMVDAKFDLFLRLISHGNPTMPLVRKTALIVKNRLILYLQKIRFSPIIKKIQFWHKNVWKEKYAERHSICTDMFLTIFSNFLFKWKITLPFQQMF